MTHFSHDYEQGIKDERERVVALLEKIASQQQAVIDFNPSRGDNDLRHAARSTVFQAIALIKGEPQ